MAKLEKTRSRSTFRSSGDGGDSEGGGTMGGVEHRHVIMHFVITPLIQNEAFKLFTAIKTVF